MLDGVTPKQFDEVVAFDRLEPDPDDRLREILLRGLLALCSAAGMECTRKQLDPYDETESAEDEPQDVTPEQAEAMFRTAYGV